MRLVKEGDLYEQATWDQSYHNTFSVESWAGSDAIYVQYNYSLETNAYIPDSVEIPRIDIHREGVLTYHWNPTQKKYLPDWTAEDTGAYNFNAEKMKALEQLGNDSLLQAAFQAEIQ